jgi:hypothetical protein
VRERLRRRGLRYGAAALADDADDRAAVADVVVELPRRSAATASRARPNSLVTAERKMRKSSCGMGGRIRMGWAGSDGSVSQNGFFDQ